MLCVRNKYGKESKDGGIFDDHYRGRQGDIACAGTGKT